MDESTPPQTLESRTVDGLAKYIKDGKAKRIVVMVSISKTDTGGSSRTGPDQTRRSQEGFTDDHRPEQVSLQALVYPTFDLPKQAFTPTWLGSISLMQRPFLTFHTFERILRPFTH